MPCHSRICRVLCTTGVGTAYGQMLEFSIYIFKFVRVKRKAQKQTRWVLWKDPIQAYRELLDQAYNAIGCKLWSKKRIICCFIWLHAKKKNLVHSFQKKKKKLSKKSLLSSGLPPKNSKTNVCFIYLVWCWATAMLFNPLLTAFLSHLSLCSLWDWELVISQKRQMVGRRLYYWYVQNCISYLQFIMYKPH